MNREPGDIPYGVSERSERLICRRLDGELGAPERAELERLLAADPAARALLADYERGDRLAAGALRWDVAAGRTGATAGRHRRWWPAAAGAVLTAAAVVALSFLPIFRPAGREVAKGTPGGIRPALPAPGGGRTPVVAPRFVEYRNEDFGPRRRLGDLRRELIGIRGDDPNVIYIFERGRQSTRIVPVSGDF